MDEPLASLDEERKTEILPYIERLRDEFAIPIVYVSHAIAEVTRLATMIVVMSEGRVAAIGPTAEIMGRIDLFPLTGRAEAGAILNTRVAEHDVRFGLTTLRSVAGDLRVPYIDMRLGAQLRVRIRARDVMIALERPRGLSALNILPGTVAEISDAEGASVEMRLDCGGEALIAADKALRRSPRPRPRRQVYAVIKSIAFDHQAVAGAAPRPQAPTQTQAWLTHTTICYNY
jgi:molybdate transport system ATP-binding protein